MAYRIVTYYLFSVVLLVFTAAPLQAQINSNYYSANQLLQQQKYEEAYNAFKKLHDSYPSNYLFLDKTVECLINLKRYDDATLLTHQAIQHVNYSGLGAVLLGKIYHIEGDTSRAYSTWDDALRQNSDNSQLYLELAHTMADRRVFNKAIEVYKKAQQKFSNLSLSSDLANTYMQAGQYENAIKEFLELIRQDPEQIDYVQQTLIQYNDKSLQDTAILEIEDFLNELPVNHPAYLRLHQLELWLLMERHLYERAVATARAYEQKTNQVSYNLYSLGAKLLSDRKFKLAEQAYRYYIDNNIIPAKYQSMQQLAEVYTEWADYLSDYNLAYAQRRDSLYQQAFDILKDLLDEAPQFNNIGQVSIKQAELALDYLHNLDLAQEYLNNLQAVNLQSEAGQKYYIEGRIDLYKSDYDRARIAFTKSNKLEQVGDLAEKTRYYLALTDFYSGDYEFSKIQLNALERQNTSYFANDAVQLRVWIQKGLNADTTGSLLKPFASGIEYLNQGKEQEAIKELSPIISSQSNHPLRAEALLELSKHISPEIIQSTYSAISNFLDYRGDGSPLQERLLWEKARIADQVITDSIDVKMENTTGNNIPLPTSLSDVQTLYENILLKFPNGFYATYARERLQELKNPQT